MSLSICIPTYNRVNLLKETLDSLLHQLDANTDQVIISDNCSTDCTQKLVEKYKQEYSFITYFRWPSSVEVGLNLLKSVELACSDFCWFLTDDDIIEADGIKNVKRILSKYPDCSGISMNAKGYDKFLKEPKIVRFTHSINRSVYFEKSEECLNHLGAWLGYWSAQVVRKHLWMEVLKDDKYKNYLGYYHLYLLAKIIKKYSKWYFISDQCIGYRSDNESFKYEYGVIKRFSIDAETYLEIYSSLFSKKSCVTRKICKDVIDFYLFWQLVSLKCSGLSLKNHVKLIKISFVNFYNYQGFWLKLFPLFLTPKVVILLARCLYRGFKKRSNIF